MLLNRYGSVAKALAAESQKMFKPASLRLVACACLSVTSALQAQSTILEQDFEVIPQGFTGRYGSVNPGPNPYGVEGRWSEFGVEPGSPRVENAPDREGQVVFLSRLEEGTQHPLIGSFNPLRSATRIRIECDIRLAREGSLAVSLSHRNTQAASVLLRTQPPGCALWNPRDGSWEAVDERAASEQWLQLAFDCDIQKASYVVTLVDEKGREVLSAEGLLDPNLFAEEGVDNILFNPQPGSSENSLLDRVLLTAWFE